MSQRHDSELTQWSAIRLAEAVRSKTVSAREVIEAHVERIAAVNPQLNAVVHLDGDAALEAARGADEALARGEALGPLHGVPFTVKDLIGVAEMPWTSGTLGRAQIVADDDATAVRRLRAAGAIPLGKTNTPEIGFAVETDNLVYGRTQNPYDLSYTPGGSSGGEASIIAAGGSPLGIGSDSGGSIRLPAHFCGIAGLCPTSGRIPRTGTFPPHLGLGQERAQLGPMARSVDDLWAALVVLAGPDWRDPLTHPMPFEEPKRVILEDLRVSFHLDNGVYEPSQAIKNAVECAAASLVDLVARVENARPEGIDETPELVFGLSAAGLVDFEKALRDMGTEEISPLVIASIEAARVHAPSLSLATLGQFIVRLNRFRGRMVRFLENYDVILCPVAGFTARRHGALRDAETVLGISYTQTYNLTGWPSVSVNVARTEEGSTELPVGVQIVAAPGREAVALRVASELEARLGGYRPPEPLSDEDARS